MSFASDLKVLYHLALKPVKGHDHAARMESFYAGQAEAYDDFRRRLLQGREELWQQIDAPQGGIWVDMGGGTGGNVEFLGDRVARLGKFYVVDLATSLLKVAAERAQARGWHNVQAVEADATKFCPAEGAADVVSFSYSLTMIPDWFAAIDNALRILKPGGRIAVVDFYVSRKHPGQNLLATPLADPHRMADLVCPGQRVPVARPSALPATAVSDGTTGRASSQGAVPAAGADTLLPVHRRKGQFIGVKGSSSA